MLSVTDNSQGARGDVGDVAALSSNSEANLCRCGMKRQARARTWRAPSTWAGAQLAFSSPRDATGRAVMAWCTVERREWPATYLSFV